MPIIPNLLQCFLLLLIFFPCRSLSSTVRNCSLLHELWVKWRREKVKMRNVQKKRHKLWLGQFGCATDRPAVCSRPGDQVCWLHFSLWASKFCSSLLLMCHPGAVWLSMLAFVFLMCVCACAGRVCVHLVRWCLQQVRRKMKESGYGHSPDPQGSCCAAALPPWLPPSRASWMPFASSVW